MFAALILAAATATASPAPPLASFAGVTLGESATALVAQKGDPADVIDSGEFVTYIYLADDASAMEDVMLDNGNVFSVTVWPPANWNTPKPGGDKPAATALGATYGGPASSVPAGKQPLTGPDGLLYTIGARDGAIQFMAAELPQATAAALPQNPKPPLHGGTSTDDAIVVIAPNESVGVRSEYVYLALHQCGAGGHWRSGSQALVSGKGGPYDLLQATCSVGGATRSFYFNIAGYFGKL